MKKSFVGLILFIIMLLAGAQVAKAGCCYVDWSCTNRVNTLTVVSGVYRTASSASAACSGTTGLLTVQLNVFMARLANGLKENFCDCKVDSQGRYTDEACQGKLEELPTFEQAIGQVPAGSNLNPNGPKCGEKKTPTSGQGCCYVNNTTVTMIDSQTNNFNQVVVEKAYMTTQTDCESNKVKREMSLGGSWTETIAEWKPFWSVSADGKTCKKETTDGSETTPPADAATKKDPLNLSYDSLTNPLLTVDAAAVIGRVIRAILSIIGSIFLVMLVYGGFVWMTAAGNEKKVATGRTTLMWAAIGIITIFLAWMLVAVILEALNFT